MIPFLATIVGPRLAKPVFWALLALAIISAALVGKCAYDQEVIARHEAERQAEIIPTIRAADDATITTIVEAERTIAAEEKEQRDAIDAKPTEPLSARQRARACAIGLRQQREGRGRAPAGCTPAK